MKTHRSLAVSTAAASTTARTQPAALARPFRTTFVIGVLLSALATAHAADSGLGHNEAAARAAIVDAASGAQPTRAARNDAAIALRDNEARAQAAIASPATPARSTGASATPGSVAGAEQSARNAILAAWSTAPGAWTAGGFGSERPAATAQ